MTTATRPHLAPSELEELGTELDLLRGRVLADLGERDVRYIRRLIKTQRALELGGRGLLFAGSRRAAWLGGTVALTLSKILDNMEIGHNVMHGQYDWMKDPAVDSRRFEWDTACPAEQWRHSHNYVHHVHTNVLGKDRDIGYGVLRMSEEEPWGPSDLTNPVKAVLLALLFEWGVAVHDLEVNRLLGGELKLADRRGMVKAVGRKAGRQLAKDYLAFPLLAGRSFRHVLTANLTANIVRNLWAFVIIFCGHFPDGTLEFSEEEVEDETRGAWYVRQMLGSANVTGGRVFHVLSGNLGHQIEHHLFPDIPAHRYAEIAVEVREICRRYGLAYNTGPLRLQFASVIRKVVRLGLPPTTSTARLAESP
jgi:fatty acid desaturase